MIHLGKNTRSTIISKGISAGKSQNSYRGLVKITKKAENARNFSQCDSLLLGDKCGAHTFPYIEINNLQQRWNMKQPLQKLVKIKSFIESKRNRYEDAIGLIVNGYCKEVFAELPMEFAVEAQKLLSVSLEGSVG